MWLRDFRGATAIEYGLIVGGVALAIATTVFTVGSNLFVIFQQIGAMAAQFVSGG
jgi:Flp pilus assembly pilin Flp